MEDVSAREIEMLRREIDFVRRSRDDYRDGYERSRAHVEELESKLGRFYFELGQIKDLMGDDLRDGDLPVQSLINWAEKLKRWADAVRGAVG